MTPPPTTAAFPGIYHVSLRGCAKKRLCPDDIDYDLFLSCAYLAAERCKFKLLAFCVIAEQAHFLLRAGRRSHRPAEDFSRLLSQYYVTEFNQRHRCLGQLFEARTCDLSETQSGYLENLIKFLAGDPFALNICRKPRQLVAYHYAELEEMTAGREYRSKLKIGLLSAQFSLNQTDLVEAAPGRLAEAKQLAGLACLGRLEKNSVRQNCTASPEA
ncbi:MAG: hypothetical protein LBL67_04800 [Coriobacteriales bacterium]|jgi:hypothetical protein|nr:hypothetical protein [Coriobacteriales bacterium]